MDEVLVDPRDGFIRRICLDRCRSILKPHLVFVCGGEVDITSTKNLTIRNMFMNCAGKNPIRDFILAEDFKDWQTGYSNLSEFENDIASISSVVTVILESPGSLVELGLFYANEDTRIKLITIVHTDHYESKSFIKFGLLDPLEELDERFVLSFNIDPKNVEEIQQTEVEDIVKDVDSFCSSLQSTEQFDKKHRGHQIFLIFQIIDIFLALTKNEISKYLKSLEIGMQANELTAALFILNKFGLVGVKKRSSQLFYYVLNHSSPRIELKATKGEGRIDKAAIKIEVGNYFRLSAKSNRSNQNRVKLIDAISEEGLSQ